MSRENARLYEIYKFAAGAEISEQVNNPNRPGESISEVLNYLNPSTNVAKRIVEELWNEDKRLKCLLADLMGEIKMLKNDPDRFKEDRVEARMRGYEAEMYWFIHVMPSMFVSVFGLFAFMLIAASRDFSANSLILAAVVGILVSTITFLVLRAIRNAKRRQAEEEAKQKAEAEYEIALWNAQERYAATLEDVATIDMLLKSMRAYLGPDYKSPE